MKEFSRVTLKILRRTSGNPKANSKCVAFIAKEHVGKPVCGGTAFFVAEESPHGQSHHIFAVTAKHCIEKFDDFEDI
jgi:hypothetical protein